MVEILTFQTIDRWLRGGFSAALLIAAASCATDIQPGLEAKESSAAGTSNAAMPKELRAAYLTAVQAEASEAFSAMVLEPGRLRVENEAQRFAATLDRSGLRLTSDQAPWSLSMRTAGLGCEGAVSEVSEAEPEADGNRLRYRHEGIEAWYLNGPLGLEQGFVIAQAPSCAGTKLVTLTLGGDLRAELDEVDGDGRGESIRLLDGEGRAALSYADLFVKDAQGKPLPAWLSVEAGKISIHVDDAGATYPVEIDPLVATPQAKLLASDGTANDRLGISVALSGDTALVGAYLDSDKGAASGSAYIFTRSGLVWNQTAKIVPSDGEASEWFGMSVALSGDTALVGAPRDNDNGTNSGSVYVLVFNGLVWNEQAKLLASDGAADEWFGYSVAFSGDTALVGARQDNDNGTDSGSAYAFVRSGGVWTQEAKLLPSDGAADDMFGSSVALSGDTALVGTPMGSGSGAAYVFLRNGGVWTQEAKLLPSDGETLDEFGVSVSIQGDMALVGSPQDDDLGMDSGSAYVFTRSGGIWTQEAKLLPDGMGSKWFGNSVALSGDIALLGAPRDNPYGSFSGSAYVFTHSGGVWTQLAKLIPSDGKMNAAFARSVALSGDTALLGAPEDEEKAWKAGAAYVYMVQQQKIVGQACVVSAECLSGFCVDGMCCDTACGGGGTADCLACSVAAGAASDGTCGVAAANTECRSAADACDVAELCDGTSSACPADGSAPDGTMCIGGVCAGGVCVNGSGGASGSGGSTSSSSSSGSGGSGGGEPADDGGCSCRAAGSASSDSSKGTGGLALALLGLMALRRRRPARA